MLLNKILLAVNLKHSSCWPSADVKPMSNDLVHVMPRGRIFSHVQPIYERAVSDLDP